MALIILLAAATPSAARTWSVAQDGSGDWTTIQESFDAAASGDTIFIAAGRYSELHMAPGYNNLPVVAYLAEAKDLTIVGVGEEDVVIGPEVYVENSIALFFDVTLTLSISGIQLVNSWEGIAAYGRTILTDCTFYDNKGHGFGKMSGGVIASNCSFSAPSHPSAISFMVRDSQDVDISNCSFYDMYIYLDGVSNGIIRDCVFEHPEGRNQSLSVNYINSNGLIVGAITDGMVGCAGVSQLVIRNSVFRKGTAWFNLSVSEKDAHVEVHDSVMEGGTYCTVHLSSAPSIIGSGNHFLNGGTEFSIVLQYYGEYSNNPKVDLRGNYWGTNDPAQIDAWIYDIHDDPNEDTEVLYQPFSDVPLPTEKKSLGSFKSLYR